MFHRPWFGHVVIYLLVILILAGSCPVTVTSAENSIQPTATQSSAPNPSNCAVYNYNPETDIGLVPTMYIWGVRDNATYRVYNRDFDGALVLGSAQPQLVGSRCVIPLPGLGAWVPSGGNVYLTRQAPGEEESERVKVPCPKVVTPSVTFEVDLASDNAQKGGTVDHSNHKGNLRAPMQLQAGKYYVVSVVMNNFNKVQSLTLPIKYDTEILQLTRMDRITGENYRFGSPVDTGADGARLDSFLITSSLRTNSKYAIGGRPDYGVGAGVGLLDWGATQNISSSAYAQTPYVNTTTGLVKLEFTRASVGDLTSYSANKIARLYFKCLKSPEEQVEDWTNAQTLHFASLADVPADIMAMPENDYRLRKAEKYYCTTSPGGYTAAIDSMNIIAPPLSVKSGDLYEQGLMTLGQYQLLPLMSNETQEQIRTLIKNRVKVYNYTNYRATGMDFLAQDVLVLVPSAEDNGAAQPGDRIKVYRQTDTAGTLFQIGEPITADGNGGVYVPLGTSNLKPEGMPEGQPPGIGTLYVSVVRGSAESEKIVVPYAAESERNIFFKLYSSGLSASRSGEALSDEFTVKKGDQLRLDIYFNDFDDLRGFGFDLTFNANIIQAATKDYHKLLTSGYISKKEVDQQENCLVQGTGMVGLSVQDELIYTWYEKYKAYPLNAVPPEVQENLDNIMQQFEIVNMDDFKKRHDEVAEKFEAAKSGAQWEGGLLFTGTESAESGRPEDSWYPYVNNKTGRLRVEAQQLTGTPQVLKKEGDGYHFLSIYFVATFGGKPMLKFADVTDMRKTNGTEVISPNDGTYVCIAGPGSSYAHVTANTASAMPFLAHWNVYPQAELVKTPKLELLGGNAKDVDNDKTALFLYDGYAFRDPGFVLRSETDEVLIDEKGINAKGATVERTIIDAPPTGTPKGTVLDAWKPDEELYDFVIPTGDGSASYEVEYKYTYYDDLVKKTLTVKRKVHVIYRLGDMSGDGNIDLFDDQWIFDDGGEMSPLMGDPYFPVKTYVDQEELERHLLGAQQLADEYAMPVTPKPELPGSYSKDASAFQLYTEFYKTDGTTKLDSKKLPVGEVILLTVRGKNLAALGSSSLLNIAVRLSYDPTYLTLPDFTQNDAGATYWNDSGINLNASKTSADAANAEYQCKASIRQKSESLGELYFQYVNKDGVGLGAPPPTFTETSGQGLCLAAFRVKIKKPISEADGVTLGWPDYLLTTVDGDKDTKYNLLTLSNSEMQEPKPVDLATADATTPQGYNITGTVISYNAKNPITYELYKKGDDGTYGTKVVTPSNIAVAAVTTGDTAGLHTQPFTAVVTDSGVYQLVLKKSGHVDITIRNINVQSDVRLEDFLTSAIEMICGDIDGDGTANAADGNYVTSEDNFTKSPTAPGVTAPQADLDGDGWINAADGNIIISEKYFGKSKDDATFNL